MSKPRDLFAAGLSGWQIADRFDFKEGGDISVQADGTLSLGRGQPATGLSYRGAPPPNHYQLTWEARRTDGSDFFCGLTFPIRGNFATLIVGGWGGGVVGVSNIDGLSAVENETTDYREFENNRWYKFKLTIDAKSLVFSIDDEKIIDIDHEGHEYSIWWEQEQMTPLGFATWYSASEIRKLILAES